MRHYLFLLLFCLPTTGIAQTSHPLADSVPGCLSYQPKELRGFQKRGDQVQTYDLLEVVYTPGPVTDVFPRQLNFTVTLSPLMEIADEIDFYAPAFQAFAANLLTSEGTRPLDVQMRSDGIIRILLDSPLSADRPVQLQLTGRLLAETVCTGPSTCNLDGMYQHLATAGWYPMSAYHPTDDRFTFVTRLSPSAEAGRQLVAVGQATNLDEGVEFRTSTQTFLPAVVMGRYSVVSPNDRFEFFAPEGIETIAFSDALADARTLYDELFGIFPYPEVKVATIAADAAVAIGAQSLILVPEDLWYVPAGDSFLETVKEVMSHELAHQYYFNLIGITGPADAWLSEGFAEYAATRASESRTGTPQHSLRNYWHYIDAPADGDAPLHSVEVRESPIAFEVIYQKGSALLGILSRKLGRDAFDETMRSYVQRFAGQIATTDEFTSHFGEAFPNENLEDFFAAWLSQPGYANIRVSAWRPRLDRSQLFVRLETERSTGGRQGLPATIPVTFNDARGGDITQLIANGQTELRQTENSWLAIDPDLTWFRRVQPVQPADINLDGIVDGMDLLDVHYAARRGAEFSANELADVNRDRVVDEDDLAAVERAFGEVTPAPQ